jgi:hypothetical protein
MTALGGSCWERTQRLMPLTIAVPLMTMPHAPIRPPVATRAKPTIIALELAELGCVSVMDDRVLVIVSPDVGRAQLASVPACVRQAVTLRG